MTKNYILFKEQGSENANKIMQVDATTYNIVPTIRILSGSTLPASASEGDIFIRY